MPVGGGVMIVLTRMREILEVNLRDRYAVVEPGVVNAALNKHLAGTGYHYAPDPSSQGACTIGGNAATNAGGPHTLKYGVTVNHVLGLEMVTADGEIVQVGGPAEDSPGPDLVGTIVGGEGTLGIVTKIWVRLTRNPQGVRTMLAVFDSVDDATQAISDIIGAGIIPAALEMMDHGILVAVEEAFHFGFPLDAEAILLIEVDGLEVGLDAQRDRIAEICRATQCPRSPLRRRRQRAAATVEGPQAGVRRDRPAQPQLLHAGRRRAAHQAAAHPQPHPRDRREVRRPHRQRLPRRRRQPAPDPALRRTPRRRKSSACWPPATKSSTSASPAAAASPASTASASKSSTSCTACSREDDLDVMTRFRDALNPTGLLSPGKLLPTAGACGMEQVHPGRRALRAAL